MQAKGRKDNEAIMRQVHPDRPGENYGRKSAQDQILLADRPKQLCRICEEMHQVSRYGPLPHLKPDALRNIVSPWSFAVFGNGHHHSLQHEQRANQIPLSQGGLLHQMDQGRGPRLHFDQEYPKLRVEEYSMLVWCLPHDNN